MRPVAVVRHEDPDNLGFGAGVLEENGLRVEHLDVWRGGALPSPGDVAGLVVLGGTMGMADRDEFPFLRAEEDLVRDCVRQAVPLLGLCLGAQLIASALGGRVSRAPHRSLGFFPVETTPAAGSDPLFGGWHAGDRVFRWHQDTFTLPAGAELLVGAADIPNQVFRAGECAWGVQFHMELDEPLLEAWIAGASETLPRDWNVQPQELLESAAAWLPRQQARARETFAAFAALARKRVEA